MLQLLIFSIISVLVLVVPIPENVTVTAPDVLTVGQSLTLECIVTTVRGITSRVDIVWSSDGVVVETTEGISPSATTDNYLEYSNAYIISQINETADDGVVYQCEVTINSISLVMVSENVILNPTGECDLHLILHTAVALFCVLKMILEAIIHTYNSHKKRLM